MRRIAGPVCGLLIFLACVAMLVFTSLPEKAPTAPIPKVVLAADASTKPTVETPHFGQHVKAAFGLCGDEVSDAVMHKLNPELHGGSDPPQQEDVDRRAERIRCIREWAKTGVSDPCQKSEYEHWLGVYDYIVAKQRAVLASIAAGKPVQDDTVTWREEQENRDRRLAAYEATHAVPVAPSCELDVIQRQKQ